MNLHGGDFNGLVKDGSIFHALIGINYPLSLKTNLYGLKTEKELSRNIKVSMIS
jgi:hypothetical protein